MFILPSSFSMLRKQLHSCSNKWHDSGKQEIEVKGNKDSHQSCGLPKIQHTLCGPCCHKVAVWVLAQPYGSLICHLSAGKTAARSQSGTMTR